MNDLRMLLEAQNGRNNLLEKRQRKFDSECQALQVNKHNMENKKENFIFIAFPNRSRNAKRD